MTYDAWQFKVLSGQEVMDWAEFCLAHHGKQFLYVEDRAVFTITMHLPRGITPPDEPAVVPPSEPDQTAALAIMDWIGETESEAA